MAGMRVGPWICTTTSSLSRSGSAGQYGKPDAELDRQQTVYCRYHRRSYGLGMVQEVTQLDLDGKPGVVPSDQLQPHVEEIKLRRYL